MRRDNNQSLGDVIKQILKEQNLQGKLDEHRVVKSWEEVMGKMVANHTVAVNIKSGTLFVQLDSPALKNELVMSKQRIVDMMNEHHGKEVVKEVVIR